MRKRTPFPAGSREKLEAALKAASTATQLKRVLTLWLREALGLDAMQIGIAIGWHPTSVARIQSQYLRFGEAALAVGGRGGRRRQHLSRNEEYELLRGLRQEFAPACVIHSAHVHAAYEKAVGHRVPPSTITRMLARHGWTRHQVVAMSHDGRPPQELRGAEPDQPGSFYVLRPDVARWLELAPGVAIRALKSPSTQSPPPDKL